MTSSNDVIIWIFFEIFGKNFFPPKLKPVVKWSKSDMPMSPFQDVALQTPNDKIGWQNYHFYLKIKINGLKYPLSP